MRRQIDTIPTVRIQCERCLPPEALRGCRPGQRDWWLRSPRGFVRFPEQAPRAPRTWRERLAAWWHGGLPPQGYPAAQPLDVTVEIEPGRYTLGCGPRPPIGLRFQVVLVTCECDALGTLEVHIPP